LNLDTCERPSANSATQIRGPRGGLLMASEETRYCQHCGTPLEQGRDERAVYCSRACKQRSQWKRAAVKIREKRYAGRLCEDCGNDFSHEQRRGATRCKECARKRHNEQRLELHKQRGRTWADVVAYANKKDEFEDVQRCRALNGLRLLEPGRIPCLCCEQSFDSYDVRSNKVCPACQNRQDRLLATSVSGLYRGGL
jgi:hypothetical protein